MIADARSLDAAAQLPADVIIVGSGPVGMAMALRLGRRGITTLLLEAGGPKQDDHTQGDAFAAERVTPDTHPSSDLYRRRMLGGTSSVWGGRCIPFDPIDFEQTTRREGWPLASSDVVTYEPDALMFLEAGLAEFTADTAFPRDPAPALPGSHPYLVLDGIERFSRPTAVWQRYSAEIARSSQIRVIHGATCVGIETSADGNTAVGVRIKDAHGRELRLVAPRTVVAAGGIETPRLLLASTAVRSCGIGNEADLVGRYYMTHLAGSFGHLKLTCPDQRARLDYRISHDGIYCRSVLKLSPSALRRTRAVNVVFRPGLHPVWDAGHKDAVLSAMFLAKRLIAPEYARQLYRQDAAAGSEAFAFWGRHVANVITGSPRLLAFGADWTRRRLLASRKLPSVFLPRADAAYPLEYNAEQLPCRDSRISLGTATDRFGMPRIRIDWRASDSNIEGLAHAFATFKQAVDGSGVARFHFDEHQLEQALGQTVPLGGHHMGTARMGTSPSDSVVDTNGEVWGTRGLFIAGSAIFPTAGFANPTLTAVALAIRQVDGIARSI